ncbi:MAG: hypothetical protein A2144_07325 [Chloroflexi bacterium RBG_16_50_9]|nr:MAG: hypothetical protein A2144_07325 [Chloroflexi bacterium RBG_16_50_9]
MTLSHLSSQVLPYLKKKITGWAFSRHSAYQLYASHAGATSKLCSFRHCLAMQAASYGVPYIPRGVVTPGEAKQKKRAFASAILWDNLDNK